METSKEILNPEIWGDRGTFQKQFPYPQNAICDIFGDVQEVPPELLSKAEEVLEDIFTTLYFAYESEIFLLFYKEGMTFQKIAGRYGGVIKFEYIEGEDEEIKRITKIAKDEDDFQRIFAKILRKMRHPSRSKKLRCLGTDGVLN